VDTEIKLPDTRRAKNLFPNSVVKLFVKMEPLLRSESAQIAINSNVFPNR
jgi:hypothetical protein